MTNSTGIASNLNCPMVAAIVPRRMPSAATVKT
jgi:hypothetical protein